MAKTPNSKKSKDAVAALQARVSELESELHAYQSKESLCNDDTKFSACAELSHLYESAPVGLALIDTDLRYIRVNQMLASINGVPQEEHIGRTVREVIPGIADILEPMYHDIIRTGQPMLNVEIQGATQTTDENPNEYLVSYIPIKNDAGGVCGISIIVKEVSTIRYGGISLRESEARHRAVLQASLDPMVVINEKGMIQSASTSLQRVFGWRVDDVVGKNISILMPNPYQSEHDRYLDAYRSTGQTWILGVTRELQALRKDGTEFPCEVSVSRVNMPDIDKPLFTGIIRDISERKESEKHKRELEAQLRQSQKMEAIGALASGIAHDFNNLITAIFGYISLMRLAKDERAQFEASLAGIEKAASQASSLTESLLTFSRKSLTQKNHTCVADILCETMKFLNPVLPSAIKVDMCISQNNDCWLKADATQLKQVFMNLVINARDAMPDGGSLCVTCRPLRGVPNGFKMESKFQEANNICIEFIDSGLGMSEDVRNRIFEPFFTTKPRGQGTGLGMSIVYGIVAEHGGLIEVESEESQGTTVRLLFPSCTQALQAQSSSTLVQSSEGSGETILIVEDNQQIQAILSTAIVNKGYQVLQASNGEDAIHVFHDSQVKIDLVILDNDLPKRSGKSCLEVFRRHQPSLPVIMITASEAIDVESFSGSAIELLLKPFRVDQVTELIHKQLQ